MSLRWGRVQCCNLGYKKTKPELRSAQTKRERLGFRKKKKEERRHQTNTRRAVSACERERAHVVKGTTTRRGSIDEKEGRGEGRNDAKRNNGALIFYTRTREEEQSNGKSKRSKSERTRERKRKRESRDEREKGWWRIDPVCVSACISTCVPRLDETARFLEITRVSR